GYPSATPSVSANGATNGIVWAIKSAAYADNGPQVLYAFDAADVSRELYNSSQMGDRDVPGPAVKFAVPTVANGRVYVGTANALAVFGNGQWAATPIISPTGGAFSQPVHVVLVETTPG